MVKSPLFEPTQFLKEPVDSAGLPVVNPSESKENKPELSNLTSISALSLDLAILQQYPV